MRRTSTTPTPPAHAAIDAYLAGLPADRRAAVEHVRALVNRHLPSGYVEAFANGSIAWVVPLSVYPDTYNEQPLMLAALADRKAAMSLYLMGVYGHAPTREGFVARWQAGGKRLDMGQSCVRFKTLADLAEDAVAWAIAAVPMEAFVAHAKAVRATPRPARRTPGGASR